MSSSTRLDKIVIVDDDARIRDLLRRFLSQEGFDVLLAEDGRALDRILQRETINLMVLDLMLPGEDGLQICRCTVYPRDYLGKPFNPRELLARIHAVLRRRPPSEVPGAPSSGDHETIVFGAFSLDLGTRAFTKNGQAMPLTTGEFAMLKALARHPKQPLTRDKLAQLARGREFEPFDRSLDVQISRLRKMIEVDPATPKIIQTVCGVGYVFVPDGQP